MKEKEEIKGKIKSDYYYKKIGILIILVSVSFISSNITIMFLKLYSDEVRNFFALVGDWYVTSTLLGVSVLIQGINYSLKNRMTTSKEDFALLANIIVGLLPIVVLSSAVAVESIISNEMLWLTFFYLFNTTVAFLLLYYQLMKLAKKLMDNFLKIVPDPHDRLSVAITITGVVISLIALLK